MKRYKDITGRKFGLLVVIENKGINSQGNYLWECQCDCGKQTIVSSGKLINGHTKSCGCLKILKLIESRKTHGMANTRFYKIWRGIRSRCINKNIPNYNLYGGRGIKCLWESFEEFKKDMYESYLEHVKEFGEKQTSIDRVDNNGYYCKENCRWANKIIQANNRRSNRNLVVGNVFGNLKYWSAITGIKRQTIQKRIDAYGWTIKEALTTPVR